MAVICGILKMRILFIQLKNCIKKDTPFGCPERTVFTKGYSNGTAKKGQTTPIVRILCFAAIWFYDFATSKNTVIENAPFVSAITQKNIKYSLS